MVYPCACEIAGGLKDRGTLKEIEEVRSDGSVGNKNYLNTCSEEPNVEDGINCKNEHTKIRGTGCMQFQKKNLKPNVNQCDILAHEYNE